MRRFVLFVLGSLCTFACGSPAGSSASGQAVAAQKQQRPHVLVISIDALRPIELVEQKAQIPTLRGLAKRGAVAWHGVETVRPSLTYPAHTTMVTGVSPARHGIVANTPLDPKNSNQDGWYWYASDIRVPTLWDVAKRAGLRVASVYWPVTVGADMAVNVPQMWRAKNDEDDKLMLALTTPSLSTDLRAAKTRLPAEHRSDWERSRLAEYVIRRENADLTFVYLTDLDVAQHDYGPGSPEAMAVLTSIDAHVARLVKAARERDPKTTVVVLSDHGFVPVTREFRPNVALREGGFLTLDENNKIRAWVAGSWRWNGTGAIVLRDRRDEATKERVRAHLEALAKDPENGIARIGDASDRPELKPFPDVAFILDMRPGTIVTGKTTGSRVAIAEDRGAHGYDPKLPEMRATLLLEGERVRGGATMENVKMEDVAPTIAALLGLEMRDVEGRVLLEALR